jgi:broad specificity phosphatase PhoE
MTANAIAAISGALLTMMDGLREIDFGKWEGLTWSEIELRDPHYARQWMEQFPNLSAPGGEPFEAFRQRVEDAFPHVQSEMKRNPSSAVAVVAHSGVLGVLLARASGQPFRSIPAPANAAVFEMLGGEKY